MIYIHLTSLTRNQFLFHNNHQPVEAHVEALAVSNNNPPTANIPALGSTSPVHTFNVDLYPDLELDLKKEI
jgi:hypothetical protein